MDNKTNPYYSTFEFPLCLVTHRTLKDSEFPVSEAVMKLLAKLPAEVYRAKYTSRLNVFKLDLNVLIRFCCAHLKNIKS